MWHGFNRPLLWSVVAIVAGATMYMTRTGRRRAGASAAHAGVVQFVVPGLAAWAEQRGQQGDRRRAVGFAADLSQRDPARPRRSSPGALLLSGEWWPGWPDLVDTPMQAPMAAVILGAAIAAAGVVQRSPKALFLGVIGYSMAGLFVIQGAPNPQRRAGGHRVVDDRAVRARPPTALPDRFGSGSPPCGWCDPCSRSPPWSASRCSPWHCRPAPSTRPHPHREAMIEHYYTDGGGRNVVNVILVEFVATTRSARSPCWRS